MKSNYQEKDYTIAQIAFMAGIVDSHSGISIGKCGSTRKGVKTYYYRGELKVEGISKELIDWIASTFGGNAIQKTTIKRATGAKFTTYYWTATDSKRLPHVLSLIEPYCVSRKKDIGIVLEFLETFNYPKPEKKVPGAQPVPDDLMDIRIECYEKLRRLNFLSPRGMRFKVSKDNL